MELRFKYFAPFNISVDHTIPYIWATQVYIIRRWTGDLSTCDQDKSLKKHSDELMANDFTGEYASIISARSVYRAGV